MRSLLPALLLGLASPAHAQEAPWVFEFSLGYKVASSRAMETDCHKVVPLHNAQLYAQDQRPGWTWSCGGRNPIYSHSLGRRCWDPKPERLVIYCVWEHQSHAFDNTEIHYDALALRGRFTFGFRRKP